MRRIAVAAMFSLGMVLIAYALSNLPEPGPMALPVLIVLELPLVLSYYLIGVTATFPYLLFAWLIWGTCSYVTISIIAWVRSRVLRDGERA